MSTAGKVLISLIMLMALVWIISFAGVDQLNRNGNEQLKKLHIQVADLSEKVKKIQHDIIETKDKITVQQETADREISRLRSNQSDFEHARSENAELLVEVQLELANVEHTVNNAKLADERRLAEGGRRKKRSRPWKRSSCLSRERTVRCWHGSASYGRSFRPPIEPALIWSPGRSEA